MTPISPVIDADLMPGLTPTVYAKNQQEYISLPAIISSSTTGRATTRWKLTWQERFKVFFTGTLFIQVLTFGDPLMPLLPTVDQPSAEECV